jgi:hypothetical protein
MPAPERMIGAARPPRPWPGRVSTMQRSDEMQAETNLKAIIRKWAERIA